MLMLMSLLCCYVGGVLALTTPCLMDLHNSSTQVLHDKFVLEAQISYQIYFYLKEPSINGVVPFELYGNDTFAPDLWVWATGQGKSLLRLPMDNKILSLGFLTLKTSKMNVEFSEQTSKCLKSLPYDEAVHYVAEYLYEHVTGNGSIGDKGVGAGVVCRSAYAFDHLFYGYKGIGYKCCDGVKKYLCDKHFSDEFQLIWYGPIVIMCFLYLIGFLHLCKLYNKSFEKTKMRELHGVVKSISEIKADILNRIVSNTEKFIRIHDADELIAMREKIRFLDVMGIGKERHQKIVFTVRVLFAVLVFLSYYVIWGVFLVAYESQLGREILLMDDSKTVYLNIVGHIGWIFTKGSLSIHKYAIFECIYTAFVPPMTIFLYFSLISKEKQTKVNPQGLKNFQQSFCKLFGCTSIKGRITQYTFAILITLHFTCLSGVFLSYVIYMVFLGVLSNIDILSPWVIPVLLCFHFFQNAFNPIYEKYKRIKDQLFALCIDDYKALMIKQNKEYFLPRALIESYYIKSSTSLVYTCVMRVFLAFTALLLLTLIVLTLQYPYNSKLTSLAPFLGVQVALILPYLAKTLSVGKPHFLEAVLMKKDLNEYVAKYVQEQPDMTSVQGSDEENGHNDLLLEQELHKIRADE